jgi:acyl carrier protein
MMDAQPQALTKLRTVIAESMGVDVARVTAETALGDLGATSLDLVEVAMVVEDVFGATIDAKRVTKAMTIAEVAQLLAREGEAAGTAP